MTQVVIIGGSSLLGHHLIGLLAESMVQTIAFIPEDEALFFVDKYPSAKLAFLPFEPKGNEQVSAFLKTHRDISHIIILGPHPSPTESEFDGASKTMDLNEYKPDGTNAFATANGRLRSWLNHISGKTVVLESSLRSCDADDSVMNEEWKVFTHRDICMVSYANAVKSLESASRYTDAMVEHTLWNENRWCYPPGRKVALPTAPLTGPGLLNIKYKELDFTHREHVPLFIDVRDAALVFRHAIFATEMKRHLVAQGVWDEDKFQKLSHEKGHSYPRRRGQLKAGCDTYALQSATACRFRTFEESLNDTFDWINERKDLYS